ncbi:MAG: SusC/RagA family TonB-linked outer membrane protein [Pelobium sp.]
MKKQLLTIAGLLLCTLVFGQGVLRGRVVDARDLSPLAGANVQIPSLKINTICDANGVFSLYPGNQNAQMSISFLGYSTLDTLVADFEQVLLIRLQPNEQQLQEVTVSTGYQKLQKERSTGSFSQLSTQQLERVVSPNLLERLDGNVSGLVFNRTNQENDITIRGRSTLFATAQPLIVIDNFPYDGDLSNINPNDVETVTILKDAAAASVWGTRAGNGVIVITTKKGKLNQPLQVSFNANTTLRQKPDLFYEPRMGTPDFIAVEQKLFQQGYYSNLETSPSHVALTPVVELLIAKRDGKLSAAAADAQIAALGQLDVRNDLSNYVYQNALQQQYYVQLSGGSQQQKFNFSMGLDDSKATLVGNANQRISLNGGNTFYLFKNKLAFQQDFSLIYQKSTLNNTGTSNLNFGAGNSFIYPYMQLADSDGKPLTVTHQYRQSFVNDAVANGLLDWSYQPLNEIDAVNHQNTSADYRIGLNAKYQVGSNFNAQVFYQFNQSNLGSNNLQTQDSWYTRNQINSYSELLTGGGINRPIALGSILDEGNGTLKAHHIRLQLNYAKAWKQHEVQAFGGYELGSQTNLQSNGRQYGYQEENASYNLTDYLNYYPLSYDSRLSSRILYADGRSELTDHFLSYYANAAYTYRNKYTFTSSARIDQSNLFGVDANQKGVPLGSVGLRWDIGKEAFYKVKAIPQLALRMSFGYSGNIDKSLSAYTTARTISNSLLTALTYARVINPPNPSLRWERTRILNFGLDFGLKNQRIIGSLEYYVKDGLDLIGDGPLPPSVGTAIFRGNTANTKGQGIDLTLHSRNLVKALGWQTDFLLSYASDKVSSYSEQSPVSNYLLYGSGTGNQNLLYPLVGKPLFAIYSYPWAGLNPQTGAARGYATDGKVTEDYAALVNGSNPDNIIYHGSARPLYFGSIRNSFSYRQFSLSANVVYRLGYYIRKPSLSYNKLLTGEITHGDYAQRWQQAGDELNTNVPAMPTGINNFRDQFYLYSAALVEKGDHIRLQDVNLSYQLKAKNSNSFIKDATLYLYMANLGILWKAGDSFYDPDYFTYKPAIQSSLGVKLKF